MILTQQDAIAALDRAWPLFSQECLKVLGSELHYQAMLYHALRCAGGVPVDQLGMNVKQWLEGGTSERFRELLERRHEDFRRGVEPIPDAVIFSPAVRGDWRRRSHGHTIKHMLAVIEMKASERANGRLQPREIADDLTKLHAHREEVRRKGREDGGAYDFYPVMIVVDSAPAASERMTPDAIAKLRALCRDHEIEWRYVSPAGPQVCRPTAAPAAQPGPS